MAESKERTKEPLDESERGKRKSWLKTQHSNNKDHDIQSYHFMTNRRGKFESSDRFYYLGFQYHLQMVTADMKLKKKKLLCLWKRSCDKSRHYIKSRDITLLMYSQSYDFSSNHVWMWNLDHKESWALKNWCFWIALLEKTLESPLDNKEIKPVNPKGS